MKKKILVTCMTLLLSGFVVGSADAIKPEETPEVIAKGKAIFNRSCILCHGIKGKGDGPAAFFFASYVAPRPRDFTQDTFKFRTTPYEVLPADQDLFRTVTNGVAGVMPPFEGLTEEERWQVIAYVKTFNPKFKTQDRPQVSVALPKVPFSPKSIAAGRKFFQVNCVICHGSNAQGDGMLFQQGVLKEFFNLPIQPRDLSNLPSFRNGASPQDIFRTLMTGMHQMPPFAEALEEKEEVAWNVVNYIMSLSRTPREPK